MTYYKIHFKHEVLLIIIGSDIIIQAPPQLSKFIGRPWMELRQVLEALEVLIEPVMTTSNSDFITFNDTEYEIKWNDERTVIRRISKFKNGRLYNIQFSSLPLLIRNALC